MKHRYCHRIGLMVFWLAVSGGSVSAAGKYLGPSALVVSKDGKTLYVACTDACEVTWVDLPGGNVTRRVTVPAEPTGIVLTPDGKRLIVTCAAPQGTIAVLEPVTGELLTTIPAGHTATGPAISPDGSRLYVCNRFDNDVSVIDLATGKETARIKVVREPIDAAVTPDGRTVLVANHLPLARIDSAYKGRVSPVVTVIDTQTHETSAIELPHGSHSLRRLDVSPDGKHALVTHLLSNFERMPFQINTGWISVNVISVIDTRTWEVLGTIGIDEYYLGAGNPFDVAYSPDGQSVCVSVTGTHELCVIDRDDLLSERAHRTMRPMMGVWPIYVSLGESLWHRHKLSGKGPRGLAVAGSKVYVAQYFSDTVAVFDLQGSPIQTIPLGPPVELTEQRRGEILFHDATICYQQWISCASCHPDGRSDSLKWDLMNDGPGNSKNTKSMLLAHRTPPVMAEGVRESAELAVRAGIAHILFAKRPEHEAAAIDVYLRSLEPVPSPHLVDGRLSAAAERGRELFHSERVSCHRCHSGPLFTDLKMHNVKTRSPDEYNTDFDTPTLVEVWRTAPYLHDGRYATIKDLLVEGRHGLRPGRGADLSEQQINDLIEFVLSL